MSPLHDLTTVAQPVIEQGRIAAGLLLDLLRQDDPPGDKAVVVPTHLVLRATTAPRESRPLTGPARRRDVSDKLMSAAQTAVRST
jgi:hypothetical protein